MEMAESTKTPSKSVESTESVSTSDTKPEDFPPMVDHRYEGGVIPVVPVNGVDEEGNPVD